MSTIIVDSDGNQSNNYSVLSEEVKHDRKIYKVSSEM